MSNQEDKRLIASLGRRLTKHPVCSLAVLAFIAVGATLWHVSQLQERLVKTSALESAHINTEAISAFRTLYTANVVERVRKQGIEVTHDYHEKEGAIPLPATMSIELGNRMGERGSGSETRLYSAYPFPWRRETGGLRDEFAREAWRFLRENPGIPFYRFEELNDRPTLRYATADLMRPSCVECHNTHPQTPKSDWAVGDVRGVLEVIQPLDTVVAQTRSDLAGTLVLLLLMAGLGSAALALVTATLRRNAAELERRVLARTKELQENEQRTQQIIDTALDAVVTMDDTGTITGWSPQAEAIFGWPPRDAIGTPLAERIIPPSYREAHFRGFERYLATGEQKVLNKRIEITALHRNGHEFPVELAISPHRQGDAISFSAYVRDITERKTTAEALRAGKEAAEAASAAKSEFLANMSHEIRTPLHGILSFARFGKDKALTADPEKLLDYFEKIDLSGQRLRVLLSDVLDLAQMESGRMRYEFKPTDLRTVLRSVQNEFHALLADRNITLDYAEPGAELRLTLDENRMAQVVRNLLSNAVKFSPDGGTISLAVSRTDASVIFSVRDEGVGIPEEELEMVFDKFAQSSKTKSGAGGTGLGLSICQAIMAAHQGRIWAENSRPRGAVFRFELPLHLEPGNWSAEMQEARSEQPGAPVESAGQAGLVEVRP